MPSTAGRRYQAMLLVLDLGRQRIDQALEFLVGLGARGWPARCPSVRTKQTVKAKLASQKFWAISLGNVWTTPR